MIRNADDDLLVTCSPREQINPDNLNLSGDGNKDLDERPGTSQQTFPGGSSSGEQSSTALESLMEAQGRVVIAERKLLQAMKDKQRDISKLMEDEQKFMEERHEEKKKLMEEMHEEKKKLMEERHEEKKKFLEKKQKTMTKCMNDQIKQQQRLILEEKKLREMALKVYEDCRAENMDEILDELLTTVNEESTRAGPSGQGHDEKSTKRQKK